MRSTVRFLLMALTCLVFAPEAQAWELNLQCVPFARAISGIRLFGDAWHWWSEATGRYGRGQTPSAGSVLSFRPTEHMPLGHVAVVTRVVGPRRIELDHANWSAPGEITTSAAAIDVSPQNDWSSVRVELGRSERFGGVYPTDGFIYARGQAGEYRDAAALMYVGKALAAARDRPQFGGVTRVASSVRPGFMPWNPIPMAPPMPVFPGQSRTMSLRRY